MTVLTPQQKLAEAEQALHDLSLGAKAVEITRDGQTVKFNQASVSGLRRYISDLKAEIAGSATRRPIGYSQL